MNSVNWPVCILNKTCKVNMCFSSTIPFQFLLLNKIRHTWKEERGKKEVSELDIARGICKLEYKMCSI